jgi:plasmid stabilization system protein ParE
MATLPTNLHPLAIAEARAARNWYGERSIKAAARFVAELDRAVERIATTPKACPSYLHGTRVYRLRRFPYLVVYLETSTSVDVIAVAHGRRKPGYWKKRVP